MLIDKELEFSDSQAVVNTGDTASTNSIDAGAAGDALGHEPELVIQVDEAVTSAGAATVQARLETAESSDFSDAETLFQTGAIAKADLVIGATVAKAKLPRGLKRYNRVVYTVGTAALTAGKFSAFLTPAAD